MNNNQKIPHFVAIKVEDFEGPNRREPFPHLAGRLYYLFSTSKKEHTNNLSAIGEETRAMMNYYDHARPSVLLPTPNYTAPDLERGKGLTWAVINVLDTVVWLLNNDQTAKIVCVSDKESLAKELTMLRDQKREANPPVFGDRSPNPPPSQP
ncbi:MAG: hypothetical protein WC612_06040 [Bdellovibrionales bacterium]|jgi:hypothetical protein